MREENPYVTNESWRGRSGRPDAIDDVADQFERPTGSSQFWASAGDQRRVVNMQAWSARRVAVEGSAGVHQDVAHG